LAAAVIWSAVWVERPTIRSGPTIRRASATDTSSWPTWTPSALAPGGEFGGVVDDEERAVAGAEAAEFARGLEQLVVGDAFGAQLDSVDAAA